MYIKKELVLVLLIITFSLGVIADAVAGPVVKSINAYIAEDISIKLNGRELVTKDEDGTILKPIIYNGRSYVPLRAISDAFNIPVDWDPELRSIYLGQREGSGGVLTNLKEHQQWYVKDLQVSKDSNDLFIHGNVYAYGLVARNPGGYAIMVDDTQSKAYELNKHYNTLSFKVGVEGEGFAIITIKDENDTVLKKLQLTKDDKMKYVELNVSNVSILKININGYNNGNVTKKVVIAEPRIK